jgi:hypothetical protein
MGYRIMVMAGRIASCKKKNRLIHTPKNAGSEKVLHT